MSIELEHSGSAQAAGAAVLRMIQGLHVSRAVYVAAKLGIADLLADGSAASDDLARRTGTHPQSLYRILRLLAALDVLRESEPRCFALTPLGERLRTGVPNSMRQWAIQLDALGGLRSFDEILTAVRSGSPALPHVLGGDAFAYLAQHPDALRAFQASMTERTAALAPTVAAGYDFDALRTVIDVGGGRGTMLAAILAAHPRLRGLLYELQGVADNPEPALGESARCDVVAGDFFASVPSGGDAYILANVLHDWDDADCIRILRCCRRAMPPGAKVLVIERMIQDDPAESVPTLLSDLHMMILTGGMERTHNEYGRLFAEAELALTRVIPVQPPYGIFEASAR
jgi:O-methyltransferase domain/Dimerisation domain